jgi:hypothetical protein
MVAEGPLVTTVVVEGPLVTTMVVEGPLGRVWEGMAVPLPIARPCAHGRPGTSNR